MMRVEEKLDGIILRNTCEADLNYVVDLEHSPSNALYVGQWTKEQHKNALYQEDILHLLVEDESCIRTITYT